MVKGQIVQKLSRRLKAISDPTRIKILALLSKRPCCVCELAAVLSLSQPTVSRHLKQLEVEGFVSGKREKAWIIYRLSPERKCCQNLLEIVIQRAMEDREITRLTEKLESISRENITKALFETRAGGAG